MARYVEILFRFKGRFALLLIALPAVVAVSTILLYPSYKSGALLWIDSPSYFGGATPSGWSIYLTPAQNEADSFGQIMSTRTFGWQLYNRLAGSVPDPNQRWKAVLGAKLNVYATGTHLLGITASCERPPVCVALVNTALAVLREQQANSDKLQAQAGADYLTAQLQAARPALATSEDALRKYLAAHPGARVDIDPAFITDAELARLAADVQQQRNRMADLQSHLAQDQNIVSSPTAVVTSGIRIVDPPMAPGGLLGDRTSLRKGALAGGAALGLGLGYLFLLGWIDKTLRDPREIEHRFNVPVVATIPQLQLSERF